MEDHVVGSAMVGARKLDVCKRIAAAAYENVRTVYSFQASKISA